ncbi:high affinity copper uptake protein 1-like isoform X3 [Eriocheir sinensis]|uniref:high affinity copper uptake protein 1-like isoform X3 n=1 Tax=Eriocheir sinensis TaxID=95602 RepID=UPI0021C69F9D|nr:high affinity copper uptake protein 1-like isoform X3 [Eriocheir sinensis]
MLDKQDKMEMSYYFSGTVHDFLFSGVNVLTTWGMVSLCMGLMSLSLLAEGFKVARSLLQKVATSSIDSGCRRYNVSERVRFHILQTFLHIVQLTIGYMLMLSVMTYNAYFTLAVVGGAGLGYYCFALFDLPSKILGSHMSRPAQWPAGNPPPHLSEAVSLKRAAEDANEFSINTNLPANLTSVLESDEKDGQKVKCGQQNECKKESSLPPVTSLIQLTDS